MFVVMHLYFRCSAVMMSVAHGWFMSTTTIILINRKLIFVLSIFQTKNGQMVLIHCSCDIGACPHHVLHHLMLTLICDWNLFLQASAWISRAPWILLKWRTRKLHWPRHVCSNQSACELCPSAYPKPPPPQACARTQLSQTLLLICRIIISTVGFKMTAILIRRLADRNSTFFKSWSDKYIKTNGLIFIFSVIIDPYIF